MKFFSFLIVLFTTAILSITAETIYSSEDDFITHEAKLNRDYKIKPIIENCKTLGGNVIYYGFTNKNSYTLNSSICVKESNGSVMIIGGDDIYNKNCKIGQNVASIKECFPINDIVESNQFSPSSNTTTPVPPKSTSNPTTTITTTISTTANATAPSTTTTASNSIPTVSANTTSTSIPPPSEDLSNAVTFTTSTTTVFMLLSLLLLIINY